MTPALILGVLLGTTAGPTVLGLTLGMWLGIGEYAYKAYPYAKECLHNPSCLRRSVPTDFSKFNHLGMGM